MAPLFGIGRKRADIPYGGMSMEGRNVVNFNLEDNNYLIAESKGYKIKGVKSGEEIERVRPDRLELVYRREPMVSAAINLYEEMIVASDINVRCEDPKIKKEAEDLLKRLRFHYQVLPGIVKHLCVFGNAWNEVVWNKTETDIVRLDTMDPKYMDFGRTERDNNIRFNEMGEPEYYVQYLRDNQTYAGPDSNKVAQGSNQGIKFETREVMLTRYQTVGDCYSGIGVIEPVFNTILNKVDIQTGLAQSTLRLGFPIIGMRVGNKEMLVSPQMIEEACRICEDLGESTSFAIPWYYEPILLEPKRSERVQANLEIFIDQMIAGLGIPKSLITGAGEQENKQTLRELKTIMRLRMKSMQRKIAWAVEEQVFKLQGERSGWKEIPSIEFGDPAIEAIAEKAERICEYAKAGVLTPTPELEKVVKESEGLEY